MLPIQCSQSVLDTHNPANYTPIKTCWEVQGKRGCCWVPLGNHTSFGDLAAVRAVRSLHRYKRMRVRKAAELGIDAGPWRVFRFGDTE